MPLRVRCLSLFILMAFTACALPKKPVTPDIPPHSYTEFLDIIRNRNEGIESLDGRMASRILNPAGKTSSSQLIILKKPSFMRLDFLTPFGQPALTVTTDGERVDIHYHTKGRFFSGSASDHNISGIFPASLSLRDLVMVLSGGVPLIDYETVKLTSDIDRYLLTVETDSIRENVFFDIETMDISEVIMSRPGGEIIMSLYMGDYSDIEGTRFPMQIRLFLPPDSYTMDIRYSGININSHTEREFFVLQPPEGVAMESLNGFRF